MLTLIDNDRDDTLNTDDPVVGSGPSESTYSPSLSSDDHADNAGHTENNEDPNNTDNSEHHSLDNSSSLLDQDPIRKPSLDNQSDTEDQLDDPLSLDFSHPSLNEATKTKLKNVNIFLENHEVAGSAHLKGAQISARKARLVADLIRGSRIDTAHRILKTCNKKAAPIIDKLLYSAVSNIKTSKHQNDEMFIYRIYVNEGSTNYRMRYRARGRGNRIRKRTCHITIRLAVASDFYLSQRNLTTSSKRLKQAFYAKKIRQHRANMRKRHSTKK